MEENNVQATTVPRCCAASVRATPHRTVNHKRALSVMQSCPNLTQQLVVERLDQAWVVDMTYIRLPLGFVYLACALDGFSRRVIGWHLSCDIDRQAGAFSAPQLVFPVSLSEWEINMGNK